MPTSSHPAPPVGAPPPRLLTVALVGVLIEAAVLVGLAGWSAVQLATAGAQSLGVGLFLVVFCLGVAAVLVAAARALRRGSRRARGPIITWQLLQGATAITLIQVGVVWGALALALALVVLGLLMTRPALAHVASPPPGPG